MEGNKTPMMIGLIVLIIVAVGVIVYQYRAHGPGAADASRQQAIKERSLGGPGTFTPAPR